MDAVNTGAVDRPVGFVWQPADRVLERGGELTHAAAAAQQVEEVAVFAVASRSDGAWRTGQPVVRMPEAEVVPELVQESADGAGLEVNVPTTDPCRSAIGSDRAVPTDDLVVVGEVVVSRSPGQRDGMPPEDGVGGSTIGLVLDIPALRIRQHDQRRDREGVIEASVAGFRNPVGHLAQGVVALGFRLGIDEVIGECDTDVEHAALPGGGGAGDDACRIDGCTGTSTCIQGRAAGLPVGSLLLGRVFLRDLLDVAAGADVDDAFRSLKGGGFLGYGRERSAVRAGNGGFLLGNGATFHDLTAIRHRALPDFQPAHGRIRHRHVIPHGNAVDRCRGKAALHAALAIDIRVPVFAVIRGDHAIVRPEIR